MSAGYESALLGQWGAWPDRTWQTRGRQSRRGPSERLHTGWAWQGEAAGMWIQSLHRDYRYRPQFSLIVCCLLGCGVVQVLYRKYL